MRANRDQIDFDRTNGHSQSEKWGVVASRSSRGSWRLIHLPSVVFLQSSHSFSLYIFIFLVAHFIFSSFVCAHYFILRKCFSFFLVRFTLTVLLQQKCKVYLAYRIITKQNDDDAPVISFYPDDDRINSEDKSYPTCWILTILLEIDPGSRLLTWPYVSVKKHLFYNCNTCFLIFHLQCFCFLRILQTFSLFWNIYF